MSMPSPSEPSRSAKRGALRPKIPTRLYGMTVVSLAVFFVGLIVWRVPVDGYLAVAEVGQRLFARSAYEDRAEEATSGSWDRQQSSALHQALADAIRYADARLASTEPDSSTEVSDERIRSTHNRLTVDAHAVDARDHRIRISFTGSDPTWSLALVEHLTRDCLLATSVSGDSGTRSARALRDARWRLDQSQHYERKARYGVEDLVDMCFARFAVPASDCDNEADTLSSAAGASPPADTGSVAEINPQWQQLQTQLAHLDEQLRPLVKYLTPNHPQIVDLSQRMELLREQLAATPQYLGAHA
jgi:hypothetical protein